MNRSLLTLVGCLMLVAGCTSPVNSKASVKIERVGWAITNAPTDWWSSSSAVKPILSYDFMVVLSGDFRPAELSQAWVYLPDGESRWKLPLSSYNPQTHALRSGGFWFSANTAELPIGNLRAEVVLADGTSSSFPFTMGQPGSKSPGAAAYVYSFQETASPSYPSVSVKALQRPGNTSFTSTGTTVTLNFTVNGDNVNNGRVWLYDAADQYVGQSVLFRDKATGATFSGLTGGVFPSGNGQAYTLVLTAASVQAEDGSLVSASQLATVTKARVMVTDGAQYNSSGDHSNFDYLALSPLF